MRLIRVLLARALMKIVGALLDQIEPRGPRRLG